MPRRVALILFVALALALCAAAWWNTSSSDDALSSKRSDDLAMSDTGALVPPSTPTQGADREALGTRNVATASDALAAPAPAPTLEPLIVTARLSYPVPGLADDRFTLYLIDPASPLAPYAGTPMRLGRAAEVRVPADLDLVQIQVTGNGLILDPQPHVRDPAGAEIELVLDVSGSLVVRVLEPWLSKPDVKVYATGSDQRDVWTEVMEGRGQTPDARGECRFDELPPGHYWVQSENSESREGGALKCVARVHTGRTTTIEIGGPEPAALVLEGTVMRGAQALAGADVEVGSFELVSGAKTQTDADGRFEVSLRGPGRYRFRIDGHVEYRDVDVLGTSQHFELPNEELCVVVHDVDGSPLAAAQLWLDEPTVQGAEPDQDLRRSATTGAGGTACFEGLAPGRYVLTLGSAHWFMDANDRRTPRQFEVEVPAAGPVQVVAALPNTLAGIVEFPGGGASPGMSIYLRPANQAGAAWQWQAGTKRGNRFDAELIAAGEYQLLAICTIDSHSAASEVEYVQVPRVASDPLRVEAHRATRLIVEARDVDGAPLRIRLAIWTADGTPWPQDGMHGHALNRQTSLPVPPGAYDVYGFTPEGAALHARVDVIGALVTQRVVLTR